ncbi:Metallo-dependent phosphatase [Athelia psychrophila]|uniref:Metallo-dependent phosphatase n=1 Tax=Athelia psychrophila TaxID=1759441 RepID=A0A166M747_9AGAM|nr:Metallo-dependent phosphatase [Fibularhizoctonia sp. CBS 109695]
MTAAVSARVYEELIPPHPGPEWTRFVCISDTHSITKFNMPPGDVLLHAGDLSSWGEPKHLNKTLEWLKTLDYPTKIIIAGNHDLCLDESWRGGAEGLSSEMIDTGKAMVRSEAMRDAGIHYLEYESLRFTTAAGREWSVYGSPAAPHYARGAFQYTDPKEAEEIYWRIPDDCEIVLTHTPPQGVLDLTRRGKHAGCSILAARMAQLNACRLHVFGHIHEGHGSLEEVGGESPSGIRQARVSVNAALPHISRVILVDLKN